MKPYKRFTRKSVFKLIRPYIRNKKRMIGFNMNFKIHNKPEKKHTIFNDKYNFYSGSFKERIINVLSTYNRPENKRFSHLFFRYFLLCIGVRANYAINRNKINDTMSINKSSLTLNTLKFIRSAFNKDLKYKNYYLTSNRYTSSQFTNFFPTNRIRRQKMFNSKLLRKATHFQYSSLQFFMSLFLNNLDINKYMNKILLLTRLFSIQRSFKLFKRSNKLINLIILFSCKLSFSYNKMSTYMANLKIVIHKIYGKFIDISFININTIHLNSDIFTEILGTKLTDRTRKTSLYIKRSLASIKIPKRNFEYLFEVPHDFAVRNYMMSFNLFNSYRANTKASNISNVDFLRFKRITGIYLEAKGRLTNRYSIGKSFFLLQIKGGLRNLNRLFNFSRVLLLRNSFEPNLQYVSLQKKRRIGAFGLKA